VMATSQRGHRLGSLPILGAVCGGLAGVGGTVHGVGEVVQGSRSTGAMLFNSWADGRIARNLGGEPAMSLIPDLLLTGILTIVASLAVLAWAVTSLERPHAGGRLVLLCTVMLLVGGGFGPPVLGMLAGAAGAAAQARGQRWTGRLTTRPVRLLGALWPYLFWVCVLDATLLVIGSLLLAVALDVTAPNLFVYGLFLMVLVTPLTIAAGVARNSCAQAEESAVR
jgi:hypothetical protein